MRYSIPLVAGQPTKQLFRGKCVVVWGTGAADEVRVVLYGSSEQNADDFGMVGAKTSIFSEQQTFTGVELTASVDCTVELIVSQYQVSALDGAALTASLNTDQFPLPVETSRGDSAGNPLFVSGQVLGDTPAATVADAAAVAVGGAAVAVLAADVTRLEAVFYNQGPDAVALGMAGLTWAKRAIVLNAGDSWIESRAASKGWVAITDAGGAAAVTVQERSA